jgi:hypothetical protein
VPTKANFVNYSQFIYTSQTGRLRLFAHLDYCLNVATRADQLALALSVKLAV